MRTLLFAAALCAASAVQFRDVNHADVIDGEYLMLLHANVTAAAHENVAKMFSGRKYAVGKLKIVGASLSPAELKRVLSLDEFVELVEPNMLEHASQSCTSLQSEPVSWGQVRTTTYSAADVNQVFAHNPTWGQDVDVYVLDTGIRCTHTEFSNNRCVWGANFSPNGNDDRNGHGTHCAGTIGGRTYGLAKSATLVAVKVLGDSGSGTKEQSIAGVNWVIEQHIAKRTGRPSVISMSLGGAFHTVQNMVMNEAVATGIPCSVAAGNANTNTCNGSPASAEHVIAVGSTELGNSGGQQVDAKSSFSNWGPCNKIWAPGSQIPSAGIASDTSYSVLSGTSMACPHVSGALAITLTSRPHLTPAQLLAHLQQTGTVGVIRNIDSTSPNILLHVQC